MTMKVGFQIIGAMKSGTSTLCHLLSQHPNICFSSIKEPTFFTEKADWKDHIEEYHAFFSPTSQTKILGEGSTSYTKESPAETKRIAEAIYQYNPEMKLIYLMRHPIERIISHWVHEYERGRINSSLADAIHQYKPLLNTSRYHSQIRPYLDLFGPQHVLLLIFENLVNFQHETLTSVLEFLDLKAIDPLPITHRNPSYLRHNQHIKYDHPNLVYRIIRRFAPTIWQRIIQNDSRAIHQKPNIETVVQKRILEALRTELDEIEALLSNNLSHWKHPI